MNDDMHLDDELESRLAAAGSADVAAPDELTVARIEHRLRSAHVAARRPRVLAPVLAGVAAAVVVVALAGIGNDARPVDTAGAGRDLAPALTTIPRLPPGDPDVDPGRDRLDGEQDAGRDEDGGGGPATTAPPEAPSGGDDGTPSDGPATTVPSDDPAPPPTRPTDSRPSDTRPVATTTPSDEPAPTRLDARVAWRDGRAVIAWGDPDPDTGNVASWSIVRWVEPPEGSLAPAREDVVLKSRDVSLRRHLDEPPERGRVTYVVRGHRDDGEVVAQSSRLVLER